MRLFKKPSGSVCTLSFDENATHRLKHIESGYLAQLVTVVDHCTVELSKEPILISPPISRDRPVRLSGECAEAPVSLLQRYDACRRYEVPAEAEINHGSDDEGVGNFSSVPPFLSEIKPAQRVRFPEINAVTQPIVGILADAELGAAQ